MSKAKLVLDGKEFELPVIAGSEGEKAIDTTKLRDLTGHDLQEAEEIFLSSSLRDVFGAHGVDATTSLFSSAVDLAAVMNKYVGETEKNLGRLLDEAAALDVVLLIDEADALFGRRSEGKETGERYANMMTNFLLTRIESHPGIVVLTTNARNRLDAAFTRRFDAIIEFPLPGVDERYRLWRSHLGARSPSDDDCRLLASYSDLPGGHIRNAVLHAAALSETAPGQPVELVLLVAALASEYHKLGRTPPPQLAQLAARGNGG